MSVARIRFLFKAVNGSTWSKLVFAAGWCLFWLAGSRGEDVPITVLLVGPFVMLVAIILLMRGRRRDRMQVWPLIHCRGSVRQSIQSTGETLDLPSTQDRDRESAVRA